MSSMRSVARGYATASGSVQPPLVLHGIDGRYASALFTAAAKKNALDAVEGDLNRIKTIGIQSFLSNPTVDRVQKRQGVDSLLKKGKYSENGRLAETTKIISAYQSLMMAHRGEVLAVVTSAKALEANTLRQLKDSLSKSELAAGKTLKMENKVNPAILGGLIVETIDVSVSSKITKYNKMLLGK
ncbi:OSCP/delta subunit of ATPase [Syncephalis plumigaleata]|nr:OSCP/delta subunit of ATPase [Syncephalis plumigaleata]